jgi:hypothetical protein
VFFRPSLDSSISGVPVIWSVPGIHDVGIKHFDHTLMVDDVLHCVDLGIAQRWAGTGSRTQLSLAINLGLKVVCQFSKATKINIVENKHFPNVTSIENTNFHKTAFCNFGKKT